jgi:F420-non-reducing hydrogenase iron-sulfur subunit
MCSGRVDLDFIFKAFEIGQDGVLIGGCKLNECNYVTHGNFDALSNVFIARNIMERIGLNPQRLEIQFMSGG